MSRFKALDPSIATVAGAAWNHKAAFSSAVIAGLALAVAAYFLVSPVYESSTSLLVGQGGADRLATARAPTETMISLARIAESEEVIRPAIERVGLEKLQIGAPSSWQGFGSKIRTLLRGEAPSEAPAVSDIDLAAAQLGRSVTVRTEPNSEVLKIVFRHRDPVVAALFANALAQSFIERQIKLLDRPGAVDFFRIQTSRFDAEVERRSAIFHAFVTKQMTYSVEDQRALLLRRSSDLAAALSMTRNLLAEKQGQATALTAQLRLLKPVTLSPFVSSLVDSLGGKAAIGPVARPSRGSNSIEGEPPLLMVKVYQDGIAALFKLNSDLAGVRDLQNQQEAEVAKINDELALLAASQTEFERLKRDVALATFNAELYAKRTVEEQIESDLRSAKLSNVRVIQGSLVPLQAVFPNAPIFAALGLVFGMIVGIAVTLLMESLSAEPSVALVERRRPQGVNPVANDQQQQQSGVRPTLHRPSLVASMAVRDGGTGQASAR